MNTVKNLVSGFMIVIGLSACPALLLAQQGKGPDRGRMESYRVAYFTRMLELTPEEAEVFWPLFNSYGQERRALQDSLEATGRLQLMSDGDVERSIDQSLDIEQSMLDLKRSYLERLQGVLPIRKVAMLNQVERRFKEELLSRLRERRRGSQGN